MVTNQKKRVAVIEPETRRVGWSGRLRRRLFGISLEETSFARRCFWDSEPAARQRLEQVGCVFLQGYHAALEANDLATLARDLDAVAAEFRGFAFEGAAMGLALLDTLLPGRRDRLRNFLAGPGDAHAYMVHVGAGWVWARLHRRVERPMASLDPLLRWLAVDGYGFHEGYFHWRRAVTAQAVPDRLCGYARRVFDQGLGRSLWFIDGADVARIPVTIATFPPARQADLWSGVGLACAYAGGVDRAAIETLHKAGAAYRPQLAQGAAFAARARQRAGNPSEGTDRACRVLCGQPAAEAAAIPDRALEDLPFTTETPAYEIWRQRIQAHFAREEHVA